MECVFAGVSCARGLAPRERRYCTRLVLYVVVETASGKGKKGNGFRQLGVRNLPRSRRVPSTAVSAPRELRQEERRRVRP